MSGTKLSHMSGIPVSHERDAAIGTRERVPDLTLDNVCYVKLDLKTAHSVPRALL
jgi:hypothetical protein